MSGKGKKDFNIPNQADWARMFTGMSKSKKKEYFKPNKEGWSKIFGEADIVSADIEAAKVETEGAKKNYLARFLSPMSGIMHTVQTEIKPEQRYEVMYAASTNSDAGFLATTITFVNEKGIPVGLPSSIGVKLNTLETDSYTPVSFVTGPVPEGAVKANIAFTVFGAEQDKVVDIKKVNFKKI